MLDARTESTLNDMVAALADLLGPVAISLGGSASTGLADDASDLDLHVFWREPLADPSARARRLASVADPGSIVVDVRSWGLEDHFRIAGRNAELIYVHLDELRQIVERAYGPGLAGEGFVTAELTFIAHGRLLSDPTGEVRAIQEQLLAAYPEPTRQRILSSNPDLLRVYLRHLRQAQARGDLLFAQHRRYTIQMVFFNLLFALNRRYHPGEKRLLIHGERCKRRPEGMARRWDAVARLGSGDPALFDLLNGLVADLCALIEEKS